MNERSTEGEGVCWEGVEMTTSQNLYVAMVHVYHYLVTMPVVMGYFNFTYNACMQAQTHTHTQMHNRSAFLKGSVLHSC